MEVCVIKRKTVTLPRVENAVQESRIVDNQYSLFTSNKILALSQLKTFADGILNIIPNIKFVFNYVENIVGK